MKSRVSFAAWSSVTVEIGDGVQQPAPGVHLAHDVVHGVEGICGVAITRSGPSATVSSSSSVTRVAISTIVSFRVEPGHLEVHPNEHVGTL